MREFVIRQLKRVQGNTVEGHIRDAFYGGRQEQLDSDLANGRTVAESLDVNDFLALFARYWAQGLTRGFPAGSHPQALLRRIVDARNVVLHPGEEDIEEGRAMEALEDIASLLRLINAPVAAAQVEEIMANNESFTVPAHRYHQGGRTVYAFTMRLDDLNRLLPERVEEHIVKDANRPLNQNHAQGIRDYLLRDRTWLLGAVLLGTAPDNPDFVPFPSSDGTQLPIGQLTMSRPDMRGLMLFDGQHRRRAIRDVLNHLESSERRQDVRERLVGDSLPIIMYEEGRVEALQQMFADASKSRRIEQNALVQFDQTDAFNVVAMELSERGKLFANNVEMERTSVPRSSNKLIAINQLAACLKTLDVGLRGRVRRERNDLHMQDIEKLNVACTEWADEFLPAAREEYEDVASGIIESEEIAVLRDETMAFSASFIRLLAGCYHLWLIEHDDWQPLAAFWRGVELRPRAGLGSLLVDTGTVQEGATSLLASPRLLDMAANGIVELIKGS